MRDDAALLLEFADTRSESAFTELVHRHIDAIYSSALRRVGGDTHLAEDVTQQVFAALAAKPTHAAHHPFLTAWLFTATRNAAANVVRAERRRKAREQKATEMHDPELAAAAGIDWHRVAPVLDAEIDRLNETDRASVLFRFVEHHDFAEIGTRLNVSPDAARMRVDRALEKLRVGLSRRGITSTATALGLVLSAESVTAAPASLATTAAQTALASSATAGSATFTSLAAMTSSKAALVVTAAALLVSGGTATYQWHAQRTAEAELAIASRALDASSAMLREVRAQLAAANAELAQRTSQNAKSAASPTASDPSRSTARASTQSSPVERKPDPRAEGFMARHPEVKKALIDWTDAKTRAEWQPLYDQLRLTPEQIARYEALMREGPKVARSLDSPSEWVWFSAGTGLTQAEAESQIRELLGEDGYAARTRYAATLPARQVVEQTAASLGFTDAPLSTEQANRLVGAVHTSRPEGMPRGLDFDWDAIRTKAELILSPDQLAALDGVRAQNESDAAYSRAAMAPAQIASATP
jgi:RNA polymerase sigma factor (sigma-70 family)